MAKLSTHTDRANTMERRKPYTSRTSRSRPLSSVPSQCSPSGAEG